MNTFQRVAATLAIVIWVSSHGTLLADEPGKNSTKSRNYTAVPLTVDQCGLLNLEAEVEGVKVILTLDTCAYTTVIHKASAKKANLKPGEKTTSGVDDASVGAERTNIEKFSLAGDSFKTRAVIMDFTEQNKMRQAGGMQLIDGLLGADFLHTHAAVIDYRRLRLYIREANKKPQPISDKMKGDRTVVVPLAADKIHIYAVKASVQGIPIWLGLDSGASETTLDPATAESAKIKVAESSDVLTTLAGAQKVSRGTVERLSIGSITEKSNIHIRGMQGINIFRKRDEAPLLGGLVGSDFLKKHAALIDYGSNTLFLRPTDSE